MRGGNGGEYRYSLRYDDGSSLLTYSYSGVHLACHEKTVIYIQRVWRNIICPGRGMGKVLLARSISSPQFWNA